MVGSIDVGYPEEILLYSNPILIPPWIRYTALPKVKLAKNGTIPANLAHSSACVHVVDCVIFGIDDNPFDLRGVDGKYWGRGHLKIVESQEVV